jgi:uncharacterized protein (TIGR02246 family)
MTATPTAPALNAQTEIESMLDKLPEFWNRHDTAGYAANFTANVDFVNVLGGHNRGRAEVRAELDAIHRTIFRNSQLKIVQRTVRFVAPQVAIAHIDWQMTGHQSMPEKPWDSVRHGIITAVLVAEESNWRITAFQNTDKIPVPPKM